jgi:poly(hydroxyalkanoate) granule associated protein phasin
MTMLKVAASNFNASRMADTALAAPRQLWLAGLGAAIATRQWAANDAGEMFRSLVKEGEVVEGRARRVIGKQVDNSIALATSAWNSARHTALTTVNGFVDKAASALPKLRSPSAAKTAKPVTKTKRPSPAKSRKARVAKRSARKA